MLHHAVARLPGAVLNFTVFRRCAETQCLLTRKTLSLQVTIESLRRQLDLTPGYVRGNDVECNMMAVAGCPRAQARERTN